MVAMHSRSKTIPISTAVLGVAVLIAAGVAGKNRIREEWYIWRLEKGDEQEQMVAAEKLGKLRSVRAASRLVAAFRMITRKVAMHPMDETFQRRDLRRQLELWGQLRTVLLEVGKPATMDLLRGTADEDDVAVAMCMMGVLLEVDEYPTIKANPWDRSRPTIQGELVLRQLQDDLSNPHDTRMLASEVLKKWFSD